MGAGNDRMKVLDLLEKGKINRDEAENLLTALKSSQADQGEGSEKAPVKEGRDCSEKAHWIQIRITQSSTGKKKLSLLIPLFFIRFGIALSKRYVDSDEERAGLRVGKEYFQNPVKGKFVDVSDPEDDERVEITFL